MYIGRQKELIDCCKNGHYAENLSILSSRIFTNFKYAAITIKVNKDHIVIEQAFNVPLEKVWRAISERELMSQWFFNIPEFEAKLGYKFQFEGGEEHKRYTHECEVLELAYKERLKFSWRYTGEIGLSFVSFHLTAKNDQTIVTLRHEGLASFTNPDFTSEKFKMGWDYLIKESLHTFLHEGKALRYW